MKQCYETLFENYGLKYDNENFTQGTLGESDFIESEIEINKHIFSVQHWALLSEVTS